MNYSSNRIVKSVYRRVNPYRYEKWDRLRVKFVRNSKARILVYTDSRGFLINSAKLFRSPIGSYVQKLTCNYQVEYHLCKKNHTTIADFLLEFEAKIRDFDAVILHVGIVDFSPRPIDNLSKVLMTKNQVFDQLGIKYDTLDQIRRQSLVTLDILDQLIDRLQFENLIYIGCNKVLSHWNGSYSGIRPVNINDMLELERVMLSSISNVVELIDWSDSDIMHRTLDNIHPSRIGFDWIHKNIEMNLKKML